MAAKLLIPGFGGKYESETFDASSTVGADTIDCHQADHLGVQVSSTGTPGGDIQLEQTFNGSDWEDFGSAMPATDGSIARFDPTDGPFGLLRIDATGITAGTAEAVTVTIVGRRAVHT